MEIKKQLSVVSPNTGNRGHKMKLVGGRLNFKKRRRQILDQHEQNRGSHCQGMLGTLEHYVHWTHTREKEKTVEEE